MKHISDWPVAVKLPVGLVVVIIGEALVVGVMLTVAISEIFYRFPARRVWS